MRSSTPTGHVFSISTWDRTRTWTLGESRAVRYTIETYGADDWIRTSMIRFTRPAPFCFEPRRHILVPTLCSTPCEPVWARASTQQRGT